MKAVKANREYTITEQDKDRFKREGYDIYDDNGNVIEYGAGKTVPFEKYAELLAKYKAVSQENIELRKKAEDKPKQSKGKKAKDSVEETEE